MAATMAESVTFRAPINIAVIKYWGKRDVAYNLPLNSSISVTLDMTELSTVTTLSRSVLAEKDEVWLNGRQIPLTGKDRISMCISRIRQLKRSETDDMSTQHGVVVTTMNSFPTASGLASSASGFACLVSCLGSYYNIQSDLSAIARQGSGSACRSMLGGFVLWDKGRCPVGSDSIATQIAPEDHWPELRILVLVVTDKEKATGSTEGMQRSADTSELLQCRVKHIVDERIRQMSAHILARDFHGFAEITMKESNQFHAICQDTYPPISPPYLNATSHKIIQIITCLNASSASNKAAYTFDAGPHAFIFAQEKDLSSILGLIMHYFPSNNSRYVRGCPTTVTETSLDDAVVKKLSTLGVCPSTEPLDYIISAKVGCGPQRMNDTLSTNSS